MKKNKLNLFLLIAVTAVVGTAVYWMLCYIFGADIIFITSVAIVFIIGAIYVPYLQYRKYQENKIMKATINRFKLEKGTTSNFEKEALTGVKAELAKYEEYKRLHNIKIKSTVYPSVLNKKYKL
jgi:hypothetical protein